MTTSSKIYLSKVTHRDASRISIHFERNSDYIQKIKTIEGRRWSQTLRCWHLPYQKTSFEQLQKVFGKENLEYPSSQKSGDSHQSVSASSKPKTSISFQKYNFQNEIRKKVVGNYIIIQQENPDWLNAYVPADKKGWVEVIKNINGRKWDVEKVCWEIPNVKQSYRQLKKYVGMQYLQFDFEIKKDIPEEYKGTYIQKPIKQKVKKTGFDLLNQSQKEAINELKDQLILKQLSHYTLKSYRNHLINIFLFFEKIPPQEITRIDIEKYILHQVKFKKISESTQNQIINSIKAYWEKVLHRPKELIEIPRPKKPKHLPNVFSQEEVVKLIESPKNLKHKLILLLIYSAGLRLSEVINIRVKDISLSRRVIFIKNGKGKKDRFVTLAEEVIPYLEEYKQQYKPNYWLLEGQTGGQYSKSSVQKIFVKAIQESKVFAYGTVHTLRHSYATHCIENGFSTALLQEALGHGSIKTTEKYLHISSKALKKLTSPLDIIKKKNQK